VTDQVPLPYKTAGKFTVMHIPISILFDSKWEKKDSRPNGSKNLIFNLLVLSSHRSCYVQCSLATHKYFRTTHCLDLQGWNVQNTSNPPDCRMSHPSRAQIYHSVPQKPCISQSAISLPLM
jgi:hypothetical protein